MEENNEIIAKCETQYDYDTLLQFNKVHSRSQGRNIVVSIIAILLLLFAIFFDSDIYLRIIAGTISIIWFVEMFTLPYLWAKKIYKTSKYTSDTKLNFTFYEDKMELVTIKKDEKMGEAKISYEDIYKVLETKNYIYLYISANQAYVCSKEKFEGDYNKITQILSNKLGKKYKIKK